MAYTKTQIGNIALNALGAETVPDIATRNSTHAIRLNAVFDLIYDEVLEAHPWHFAKRRLYVAASGRPEFGWGYSFALPTVPWCLRPLELDGDPLDEGDWTFEGREILTNQAGPLPLVFIARAPLEHASAQFASTMGYRLAAQVAWAVTNDRDTEKLMWKLYGDRLSAARSLNAMSAPADDRGQQESTFINSRRG